MTYVFNYAMQDHMTEEMPAEEVCPLVLCHLLLHNRCSAISVPRSITSAALRLCSCPSMTQEQTHLARMAKGWQVR